LTFEPTAQKQHADSDQERKGNVGSKIGGEVENQSSIFVPKLTFFRYNLDSLTINTPVAVKKTSVAFHTLGCKLNFSETASIARDFSEEHYTRVPFEDAADVYVINTCSVTENADKRFKALVAKVLRQNPDALVAMLNYNPRPWLRLAE